MIPGMNPSGPRAIDRIENTNEAIAIPLLGDRFFSFIFFTDECYIIHSMNDNMGARCVVLVGAALHAVSLSRSCCSDSAGLLAVGF